jgi:PAS domain-containing protein
MHDHETHHKDLIQQGVDQLKDIFENSDQGIYLYFDDTHKACNQKFSDLLGYSSPEEWAGVDESFPQAFVAESSQQTLVDAYSEAMEKKIASQIQVTWKKKASGEVKTTVIIVPLAIDDHLLALHFIS